MIPLVIATYIYGAFLTAYLLGRFFYGCIESWEVRTLTALWPIAACVLLFYGACLIFEPMNAVFQSTRRRYWK